MSRGRQLQPGDDALTDFNGRGTLVRVRIVERDDQRRHGHSQSGIMFRVHPPLKYGTAASWYDADWFEPAFITTRSDLGVCCNVELEGNGHLD